MRQAATAWGEITLQNSLSAELAAQATTILVSLRQGRGGDGTSVSLDSCGGGCGGGTTDDSPLDELVESARTILVSLRQGSGGGRQRAPRQELSDGVIERLNCKSMLPGDRTQPMCPDACPYGLTWYICILWRQRKEEPRATTKG